MTPDPPIKINVGGRVFETRASTIEKFPDSTLAAAMRNNGVDTLWDRDPVLFEYVLDFYREGRFTRAPPDSIPMKRLIEEFAFWGFQLDLPQPTTEEPHVLVGDGEVPLSTFLLHLRGVGHLVHCCVLWRALRGSSDLWSAASRGYRSMSLLWSNRPTRGTPASFVRDNFLEMAWLARRDGVILEKLREDAPMDAVIERNVMVCTGLLLPTSNGIVATTIDMVVVPHMNTNTILFHPIADVQHTFQYRGVFYEIHIDKSCNVRIKTLDNEQKALPFFEDLRGALLRLYVVVGNMEFPIDDDFAFPTPRSGNKCRLTADIYSTIGNAGDIDEVYRLTGTEHVARLVIRDTSSCKLMTERSLVHPLILLTPPIPLTYTLFRLSW